MNRKSKALILLSIISMVLVGYTIGNIAPILPRTTIVNEGDTIINEGDIYVDNSTDYIDNRTMPEGRPKK